MQEKKKHDCLKYQQLLPFSLASSPKTEEKVIPCQWCVGWVLVQIAPVHQIWQFQHYFTHPQLACVLLFKATYLCTCLCTHCIPRYSSVSLFPRYTQGSSSIRPGAAEPDWWLLAVLRVQNPQLKQEVLLQVRDIHGQSVEE